jgi:hypothetical protein
MSDIRAWSKTAASNSDATNGGMPEGMAPSTVNDNVRTQMAAHRTQWEDAEWFDWGHTPIYVSASTFNVSNSVTDVYTIGRKLKLLDGSNTLYGHVISMSAVAAATTKFTVSLASGNLTSSLTQVAVAILNPTNNSIPKGLALDAPTINSPTINTATINGGAITTSSAADCSGGTETAVAFTSIPSWVKQITICINGVSTNGSGVPIIQIGDSGGYENSGYTGSGFNISGSVGANLTVGFPIWVSTWAAATTAYGTLTLTLVDSASNTWAASGTVGLSNSANVTVIGGIKALSATLDRLQLTTSAGVDVFDNGSINILYQ